MKLTFSISNFGALVELDKALYGWTDTVYITITAPDHNNNSAAEETIGYINTSNSGNIPKWKDVYKYKFWQHILQ